MHPWFPNLWDILKTGYFLMKKADIKIKFTCNNKCAFCVQGDKRYKFEDKTFAHIKNELLQSRQAGANSLVFTGGEPTLHKDILKLVELARSIGFQSVQMQTNGRMFYYKNFCRDMIKSGVTGFCPALHGSSEKLHDSLTNAPGSFRQTVRGIINLKSLGVPVLTNSVLVEPNREDLPKLAKLLTALGVNCYQFAFAHIMGTAFRNHKWLIARKSKLQPWVGQGLAIGLKAGLRPTTEAIPFCFMKGYEKCIAESVTPDAIVFDADFKLDNFKYYKITRAKAKGPKCPECKYFRVCEGPWREYPRLFGWDEFEPVK